MPIFVLFRGARLQPMNEPKIRPTTQAAEGVPRLHWTLAEFERLAELGIFTEDDRIELIEGELVPMSPKGNRHEVLRDELLNWMIERLPGRGLRLSVEIGWRPGGDTGSSSLSEVVQGANGARSRGAVGDRGCGF